MELIFNETYFDAVMADMNYDQEKMPLGKLSKSTILRGFETLKELSRLLTALTPADRHELETQSNLYYSTIPHAFGRNRPPVINTHEMVKREADMLDSLSDLKAADDIMKTASKEGKGSFVHPLDSRFQGLCMQEMTPLDHSSTEFLELAHYLTNSNTHGASYNLQDIFRIERQGEVDRFEQSPYSKVKSDRRLLWHGSRATNFGGILGQGLRIAPPEAPASGYMFDKGMASTPSFVADGHR
jgi:poly [ADP-ribose] polymerase 2/3/4